MIKTKKDLSKTRTKNLYHKTRLLIARYQRRGLTFIRYNQKTMICLDKGNICPKDITGKSCKYCYKADIEKCYKSFKNGKKEYFEPDELSTDQELKLNEFCREFWQLLKQYNREDFSVRVFSFSDFMESHETFWEQVLCIFRENGINTHAITKVHEAVPFLVKLCNCVNISIDTLAEKDKIYSAAALKAIYPDKVKIRSVVLNEADFYFMQNLRIVDVHTFYHGSLARDIEDLHNYSHAEVESAARVYGNVCCAKAGKCINCMLCQ